MSYLYSITQNDKHTCIKMKDVWHTTAVEVLSERKQVKSKPWISATSEELAEQKRNARKRNDQQSYHKLKSEMHRSSCTDKNKWLEQECKKINECDRVKKSKKLFDQVKKVRNNTFTPKQMAVNSRTGITLTNPTEILGRWKVYGEGLFQKNEMRVRYRPLISMKPSPLLSEVERAIRDLHSGKAPGLDIIPAELVKASGPNAVKVLDMLCVKIWVAGIWPHEWKQQE